MMVPALLLPPQLVSPFTGQCQRLGRLHQGRRVSPAGFGKLPHFLGGQRRVTWQLWAASPGATRGLAGSSPGWRPGCPCTSSCRHVILHHAGKGGPAGPRFPLKAQTLALFSASALFLAPLGSGFPREEAGRTGSSVTEGPFQVVLNVARMGHSRAQGGLVGTCSGTC